MKIHHLNNLDEIEYFVRDTFDTRAYYENKTVSLDTTPFYYLSQDQKFDKQAKIVLTFDLKLFDRSTNDTLLSFVAEKHFMIELDGNKDFRMLRNAVFDAHITFETIFIRKAGIQLATEILKRQLNDFDEIAYKLIDQID
jgi:hypothetical protein